MLENKKPNLEPGDIVQINCKELPFNNFKGVVVLPIAHHKYLIFLSSLGTLPMWDKYLKLIGSGKKSKMPTPIPKVFRDAFKTENLLNEGVEAKLIEPDEEVKEDED